jgi:hypothetical protein
MSFLDDTPQIDDSTVDNAGLQFPVAQWHNGDPKLAQLGGVPHLGGVVLPLKYFAEAPVIPGWQKAANFTFASGKSEPALTAQKIALSVVRTRFRWFKRVGAEVVYYPRAAYAEGADMRGHLQMVCGLYGYPEAVVFTFKGTASKEVERLLREFSAKVVEAANRLAVDKARQSGPSTKAKRYPRFAFYLKLAAGPAIMAGQKGREHIVTPPVMELPAEVNADYLHKLYVGRERLLALQELYHHAEPWSAAWDNPGAETAADDEAPGPEDEPHAG